MAHAESTSSHLSRRIFLFRSQFRHHNRLLHFRLSRIQTRWCLSDIGSQRSVADPPTNQSQRAMALGANIDIFLCRNCPQLCRYSSDIYLWLEPMFSVFQMSSSHFQYNCTSWTSASSATSITSVTLDSFLQSLHIGVGTSALPVVAENTFDKAELCSQDFLSSSLFSSSFIFPIWF